MSFSQRLDEIRAGFERPFWVANITELFERLSYYAVFASLARYLHEVLNFPTERATNLTGLFGGLVWFLAIFGGAIADRLGFRRALSLAYLILAGSYFLLGSIGSSWLAPVRSFLPLVVLATILLVLPPLGVALVKPCVVGTTARASKENVRSIGYSIYYTLVNIGGAIGPWLAGVINEHLPTAIVFRMAALSVFLMFFVVLVFFKEPQRSGETNTASITETLENFVKVLGNPKFMLFLLIFSGYWIVYWQEFISLPLYVHDYINPATNTDRMLSTGPVVVFAILAINSSVVAVYVTLVVVALGEIIQAPRYYDYISRLAPPGQQGTYMGFAFLPIGIGSLIGGWFGGRVMHQFGEVAHQPQRVWWVISGVGVLTALLLWIYDRVVKPTGQETAG